MARRSARKVNSMKEFIRDDGVVLKLDADLKKAILSRPSANPKSNWTDDDYALGAKTKLERWRQRRAELASLGVQLEGVRILDVACGNGIDCILLALEPVDSVIGIDLRLSLHLANKKGDRHRRLASEVLSAVSKGSDPWNALCKLPVCLVQGDATNLPFEPESFDLILSKSFLEHMIPIEAALSEMERVLVPGGLMYHVIDRYFWLRGCHAPGLVDIPWAHARLTPNEYRHFVAEYEGSSRH
jgi:SAM-dependent methyltransferase